MSAETEALGLAVEAWFGDTGLVALRELVEPLLDCTRDCDKLRHNEPWRIFDQMDSALEPYRAQPPVTQGEQT